MNRRLVLALVAITLAGCASASSQAQQSPSPSTPSPSDTQSASPGVATGSPAATPPASPASPATGVCRDPREHVYNPDRLRLVDACMTITGTVDVIRSEADGDYHILLHLDPAFANLVNGANLASENGDLVLEPVCEVRITQKDAVQACAGVSPSVPRPVPGIHYTATGAYVLDQVHGWMELHPLWDLHAS